MGKEQCSSASSFSTWQRAAPASGASIAPYAAAKPSRAHSSRQSFAKSASSRGSRLAALCRRRAAAQVLRRRQPVLIGIISEHEPSALHAVNHVTRHARTERRASPTAAETALDLRELGADVRRAVHDDGAIAGAIVEAAIEAVKAERVAVLAHVGVGSDEQPQARAMRLRLVREAR